MALTPVWPKKISNDDADHGAGSRAEPVLLAQLPESSLPGLKGAKLFKEGAGGKAKGLPCSLKTRFWSQITSSFWDGSKDPSGALLPSLPLPPCTFSCQAPVMKQISKALKGLLVLSLML